MKIGERLNFYPEVYINTREAYAHFKENCTLPRGEKLKNHRMYTRYINAFYKVLADKIIEADAGVYVKNLGYFSIIMRQYKQCTMNVRKGGKQKGYNFHTGGRIYHPTLFTDTSVKKDLYCWTMDRGFCKAFRYALHDKIMEGKRYTSQYSLLSKILKNRG